MQLLNRQKQIPNGIFFYEPRTKWRSSPGSFDNVVAQIIAHRNANPWLQKTVDPAAVANELDAFAAQVCNANGWTDYITGGTPQNPQLPPPHLASRLVSAAGGGEVLVEWLASGAEAVPLELSDKRAAICARCPVNEVGDLLRFFTVPVTEAIRRTLNLRRDMKLATAYDDRLGVCTACDCPMKLKVHIPIDRIRSKLSDAQKARLYPDCWIPTEGK